MRESVGFAGFSGRELHRHRPLDPRAARHPRVLREAEPVERGALVVGDRRQVLHAVRDAHGVGAADAHPAARLDREPAGLRGLEQRHARLRDDVLALRLERHLGRARVERAVRGHRAAGGEVGERLGLGRRRVLALERPLLGVGAQHPARGQRDGERPRAPRRPLGPRRRGVPVEEGERGRRPQRRELVRGDLQQRVERVEDRRRGREVERELARRAWRSPRRCAPRAALKKPTTSPGKAAAKSFL